MDIVKIKYFKKNVFCAVVLMFLSKGMLTGEKNNKKSHRPQPSLLQRTWKAIKQNKCYIAGLVATIVAAIGTKKLFYNDNALSMAQGSHSSGTGSAVMGSYQGGGIAGSKNISQDLSQQCSHSEVYACNNNFCNSYFSAGSQGGITFGSLFDARLFHNIKYRPDSAELRMLLKNTNDKIYKAFTLSLKINKKNNTDKSLPDSIQDIMANHVLSSDFLKVVALIVKDHISLNNRGKTTLDDAEKTTLGTLFKDNFIEKIVKPKLQELKNDPYTKIGETEKFLHNYDVVVEIKDVPTEELFTYWKSLPYADHIKKVLTKDQLEALVAHKGKEIEFIEKNPDSVNKIVMAEDLKNINNLMSEFNEIDSNKTQKEKDTIKEFLKKVWVYHRIMNNQYASKGSRDAKKINVLEYIVNKSIDYPFIGQKDNSLLRQWYCNIFDYTFEVQDLLDEPFVRALKNDNTLDVIIKYYTAKSNMKNNDFDALPEIKKYLNNRSKDKNISSLEKTIVLRFYTGKYKFFAENLNFLLSDKKDVKKLTAFLSTHAHMQEMYLNLQKGMYAGDVCTFLFDGGMINAFAQANLGLSFEEVIDKFDKEMVSKIETFYRIFNITGDELENDKNILMEVKKYLKGYIKKYMVTKDDPKTDLLQAIDAVNSDKILTEYFKLNSLRNKAFDKDYIEKLVNNVLILSKKQ